MASLLQQIQQGCDGLALTLSDLQQQQLLDYVSLLAKWNKVYNLTSVRDIDEMVSRHLLDSLAILPYLSGNSLLDVGSGGGLPGIPLSIARPDLSVTLLDSNSKKTRFLHQVKAELRLENVTVFHARIEDANLPQFDLVTARAFSTISDIIDLTGRHCHHAGKLLLMKGVYPESELGAIGDDFSLQAIHVIDVPGSDRQRHLVELMKS
ncbi:MAG: 16S rRNA (guanine527-N7)-methyltransferase [Methylophagaceae bacterium]